MKITVVTALWKRPNVSSIMLDNLALQRERLHGELDLEVTAVGSEGCWSRYLAESHGAIYCEAPNDPLGAKWQTALSRARKTDPDGVLVLGSDNLVNDELLLMWGRLLADGADYLGVFDAFQFNPSRGALTHWDGYIGWRAGEPIGSGRCFSRALLERLRWNVWEPSYNRGLDSSTTARLERVQHRDAHVTMKERPIRHLGIKIMTARAAGGAMSPDLSKHRTSQSLDPLLLLEWFGPDIGARVLALSDVRVRVA